MVICIGVLVKLVLCVHLSTPVFENMNPACCWPSPILTELFYVLSSFLDHLVPMVNPPPAEPHCTLTPLEFSMWAMEHLEGMQGRRGLVAPPEKSVLSEVDMRLEVLGSLVHHALNKVRQEVWWVGLMLVTPS